MKEESYSENSNLPKSIPRHVGFHSNGLYAYVVNELDATITTYNYDAENGILNPIKSFQHCRPPLRATALPLRSPFRRQGGLYMLRIAVMTAL